MNAINIIMMSSNTIQITATPITTANIGKPSEPVMSKKIQSSVCKFVVCTGIGCWVCGCVHVCHTYLCLCELSV